MPLLDTDRELTRHSYYAATAPGAEVHPPLEVDTRCDVAVVGGGLAGLSAAIDLRQCGLEVVLLEAHEIGFGASGRNGGQAIHGLACEMEPIEAQLGLEEARRVWQMTIEALDLLRARIGEHGIDCDWRDGYLGVATSPRKARALAESADRLESVYRYPLARIAAADLPRWIASPRYHGGLHDPRSGHLHPLKYTRGLARAAEKAGVRLHERTPVTALEHGAEPRLRCARGSVSARQVLLAGNVYLHALPTPLAP